MFSNSGGIIKALVWILFVLVVLASIILAIFFASFNASGAAAGVLIGGPLLAWLFGAVLYGFGELVQNSEYIKNHMMTLDRSDSVRSAPVDDGSWFCSRCGKRNHSTSTGCICGNKRSS